MADSEGQVLLLSLLEMILTGGILNLIACRPTFVGSLEAQAMDRPLIPILQWLTACMTSRSL